ncbi:SH3 domain-containing protein [Chryseobacterium sp.]|uniref:SH3 domain-containing protein n=1 Tax=Chryseobacterium sp. TaxID=1871047 RepID=UPI0025BCD4C0|nr:SH3 domain-containing protein [Chryseobacterium sp.]
MKTFISILIIIIGGFISNSFLSSSPSDLHSGGRCTGAANCFACTNCSGCAHCKSGGSCGVCKKTSSKKTNSSESYYRPSNYSPKSKTSSKRISKGKSSKAPDVFIGDVSVSINSNNNNTVITNTTTKVYQKPSLKSKTLMQVDKNTSLIILSKEGKWYKIKVKKNGVIGFIHQNDIQ